MVIHIYKEYFDPFPVESNAFFITKECMGRCALPGHKHGALFPYAAVFSLENADSYEYI